jgi:small-conductance mechanosensitive channel
LRQAEGRMNHRENDYRSRKEAIKEEDRRADQLKEQIDHITEKINNSKLAQSETRFKINNPA